MTCSSIMSCIWLSKETSHFWKRAFSVMLFLCGSKQKKKMQIHFQLHQKGKSGFCQFTSLLKLHYWSDSLSVKLLKSHYCPLGARICKSKLLIRAPKNASPGTAQFAIEGQFAEDEMRQQGTLFMTAPALNKCFWQFFSSNILNRVYK